MFWSELGYGDNPLRCTRILAGDVISDRVKIAGGRNRPGDPHLNAEYFPVMWAIPFSVAKLKPVCGGNAGLD